jgi:hypothetical protein
MARRWIEQTLHTGQVAYLHARGLLELDFPVLVRPVDNRYNYVVARSPFLDNSNLFYSIWQPSQSMHNLASQTFREWYTGVPQRIDDEAVMWEAVRRVHALASSSQPDNQQRAAQVVGRVASYLTQQSNQNVPPVSLAVVAEIHAWLGELIFPHHLTASVGAASLLMMLGVPRDRVAVFGMYYQDPTVYYRPNSDWRAGFLSGTPYYTVMGIFLGARWFPIDFTVLASGPHRRLQNEPHPHVRHSNLGQHPNDGSQLVIDFAHPYTMVFASPPEGMGQSSPLLTHIPMLRLFGR